MAAKCLVIGSGLMTPHLIRTLIALDLETIVVGVVQEELDRLSSEFGIPCSLINVQDNSSLLQALEGKAVAISMIPATMHHLVLQACIETHTNLVTASYISSEVAALEGSARDAGIVVMSEIGLDPGIDHMSVAQMTRQAKDSGGKITKFLSVCGALPHKSACNNPLFYKFSWAPAGSLRSSIRPASYIESDSVVNIDGSQVLWTAKAYPFEGVEGLVYYPNGHSVNYLEKYGLQGVPHFERATLRYREFLPIMKSFVRIGLINEDPWEFQGTWAEWVASRLESCQETDSEFPGIDGSSLQLARKLADLLKDFEPNEIQECVQGFNFFGLFGDVAVGNANNVLEALVNLIKDKCKFEGNEEDIVVMEHSMWVELEGKEFLYKSALLETGQPNKTSAIAKLVSTPAALAAHWIIQNRPPPGFLSPTDPQFTDEVLRKLKEEFGIQLTESKQELT